LKAPENTQILVGKVKTEWDYTDLSTGQGCIYANNCYILQPYDLGCNYTRQGSAVITRTRLKMTIKNWLIPASIAFLYSAFSSVSAQTPSESPNALLNQLISEQRYPEAYDLALKRRSEWEGDIEFDFLYGMAAIESGQPNESVYAFERVANNADTATLRGRARLELARAYFLTNNMLAAENLFNQVLASDPPQNVRNNIQVFLIAIDANKRTAESSMDWSIAINGGHDDNVNSATATGLIDAPLIGSIELNPDGLKTADEYADLILGMVYRRFITRDRIIDFNLNLNRHDNFSTEQFDVDSLRGDVGFNHGSGLQRFRYSVQGHQVQVAGLNFQRSAGISASWQRAAGNGWFQSVTGSLNAIRFDNDSSDNNDLRDVNQKLIALGLNKIGESFTNSTNIYYANEDAMASIGEHNGRSYYGVAHSILWRLTDMHTPYLRLSLQELDHNDKHPVFFNTTRSDSTATASLGWLWQFNRQFVISGELSYTESDSNIALFSYSRTKAQAGFRYQF